MSPEDQKAFRQQLIEHEGLRLKGYTDTRGKMTIGVGRNLTDVGISLGEAMLLLENDIANVSGAVASALPWFPRITPMRQRVLLDIAINTGTDGLLKFHKMLAACEGGDYDEAANEILDSQLAPVRKIRLARMMRLDAA